MVGRCRTNSHKAAERHIHSVNGQGSDFYEFYPTSKTQRKFSVMSADQSAAESGVEYSGLYTAGTALLAEHLHLVVHWRVGIMDTGNFCRYVVDGMGG